jgi:hypothetical protein
MNHLVIRDSSLNGWEYGMLRSFEGAIVRETGADIFEIPGHEFLSGHLHHFGQGMKRGKYRRFFPKQEMDLKSDVAWYILMGPENYRLDLYKNWDKNCKTRILYLYDTLPSQYPLIKKLFSDNTWDILITSFNDAVSDLEKITGRRWRCVEQAADRKLFHPVPLSERLIHFSAYGRRYPLVHEALKEFCGANNLYYDFTTHDGKHPVSDATDLYRQYAWHLSHSLFTLSWPVELTNPVRAGHLHPITCRWFEAAASGTVILGKPPGNPDFDTLMEDDIVVEIDPNAQRSSLFKRLEGLWSDRESLFRKASSARDRKSDGWYWDERVQRILSWL